MVIAERSKVYFIPMLVLGLSGTVLAILFSNSLSGVHLVLLWILSIAMLLFALFGLLSPTTAIEKNDDCLVVNYLFRKKIIPLDKIENVSVTERGEYYNRDSSISDDIAFFSDMRRLYINYKENDILRHTCVVVKNASAVKCSIDSLIKK